MSRPPECEIVEAGWVSNEYEGKRIASSTEMSQNIDSGTVDVNVGQCRGAGPAACISKLTLSSEIERHPRRCVTRNRTALLALAKNPIRCCLNLEFSGDSGTSVTRPSVQQPQRSRGCSTPLHRCHAGGGFTRGRHPRCAGGGESEGGPHEGRGPHGGRRSPPQAHAGTGFPRAW